MQVFNDANYPSILDDNSSGFNFEFTSGNPQLFWSTFPNSTEAITLHETFIVSSCQSAISDSA